MEKELRCSYYAQNPNKDWRRRCARADHLRDEIRRDTNHGYHRCGLQNPRNFEGCAENTMIRTHAECWNLSKLI